MGSTPSAGTIFSSVNFHKPEADVHVPDGGGAAAALARVTHAGIGAHADDLEFMAFEGIASCHGRADRWFGGVVCTDGAGSVCGGAMEGGELCEVRRREQRKAADIGEYGIVVQLGYTSAEIRGRRRADLTDDLARLLAAVQPEVLYTHNPADSHATHTAVFSAVLDAVRSLPPGQRPERFIGCEVWRDLDWLPGRARVVMDVSGHEDLARRLNAVFASQTGGGKRYEVAVGGRRAAHATFADPRRADQATQVILGMDLLPLLRDESLSAADYACGLVEEFREEVRRGLDGGAEV